MLSDKVKKSLERIKAFEPPEGYYLAFSGGKDSIVCKHLLEMAGVKYDATYRVTSVDPPELVRFIKNVHPDVKREVPRDKDGKPITMWNLIARKTYPPTRVFRYCCASLKESGGDGRMVVTGVRWAESSNRKKNQGIVTIMGKRASNEVQSDDFRQTDRGGIVLTNDNEDSRRMVEQCYRRHKTTLNPIIDWSDAEVWEFIKAERIPYCELYNEGFYRLGCIGCPMASTREREREFRLWQKYKDAYLRAFAKMLEESKRKGIGWRKVNGGQPTVAEVWNWWMNYNIMEGQYSFFDEEEDT